MKQLKKQISRGVYDPNRDDPFELFITSTNIRWCYYKESHKILGNTYGMLVLQVSQSRSFTAWLDLTVLRTRTLRPLPRTFWHEQLKPSKEGVLSYYCSRLWPRSNNSTLCPWQVPKHMVIKILKQALINIRIGRTQPLSHWVASGRSLALQRTILVIIDELHAIALDGRRAQYIADQRSEQNYHRIAS